MKIDGGRSEKPESKVNMAQGITEPDKPVQESQVNVNKER